MIKITNMCPILFIHWAYYPAAYSRIKDKKVYWPPMEAVPNPLVQRVKGDEYTPGKVLLSHVPNI